MRCPMCNSELVLSGHAMWEQVNSIDANASLNRSYQCMNPDCDAFKNDIIWTYNGEGFIMHRLEAHEEALT